jgi:tRNA-specific 2-thiouridylase
MNWLIPDPGNEVRAHAQIRYNSKAQPATISPVETGVDDRFQKYNVCFDKPVEAITPGQSAVFFVDDERLIGGGRIRTVLND